MKTKPPTRVFIVDDSAGIRHRLTEMLAGIDAVRVVGEATNAREAIAGILRTRPHSVLLDLNLLGRTGFEVLRAVHAQAPEVAFVVLTNHGEPQYRHACEQAGARYFLDKTRDFAEIPRVLEEISLNVH